MKNFQIFLIFILIIGSIFLMQCSGLDAPTTANIHTLDQNAKIAAIPIDDYEVIPVGPSHGSYFRTQSNITLQWALTPNGCPDFEKYKVYLGTSCIATIYNINGTSYNLGQKALGQYSWNVRAYWSDDYEDDFGVPVVFTVEIDAQIKGPNPVYGQTGHTWYVDTYQGGTFQWTVKNINNQTIYSTTNTSGSISDSNWPYHASGVYTVQCSVTCANSNNTYPLSKSVTVLN